MSTDEQAKGKLQALAAQVCVVLGGGVSIDDVLQGNMVIADMQGHEPDPTAEMSQFQVRNVTSGLLLASITIANYKPQDTVIMIRNAAVDLSGKVFVMNDRSRLILFELVVDYFAAAELDMAMSRLRDIPMAVKRAN